MRYRPFVPSSVFVATALSIAVLIAFTLHAPQQASSAPTPPPTPPPQPTAVVTTQPMSPIGDAAATASSGGTITQSDIQNYAQSHAVPFNMTSDHGSIILVAQYTSQQIVALLGTSTGVPDATPLWLVEFQGNFVFPGSSAQPDGLRFNIAFEVYFAATGNLLLEGGLPTPVGNPTGGPTPTPNPNATPTPVGQPTATPGTAPTATPAGVPTATPTLASVPPTATPIPPTATPIPSTATPVPPTATPAPPPPHLTATQPSEHCSNANWSNPIILKNTGGQTLTWSGSVPGGYTLTPGSGTLHPGQSVALKIGPQFMNPYSGPSFPVTLTSNGGNLTLHLPCI